MTTYKSQTYQLISHEREYNKIIGTIGALWIWFVGWWVKHLLPNGDGLGCTIFACNNAMQFIICDNDHTTKCSIADGWV